MLVAKPLPKMLTAAVALASWIALLVMLIPVPVSAGDATAVFPQSMPVLNDAELKTVYCLGENEIYIGGKLSNRAILYHYDNSTWSSILSGSEFDNSTSTDVVNDILYLYTDNSLLAAGSAHSSGFIIKKPLNSYWSWSLFDGSFAAVNALAVKPYYDLGLSEILGATDNGVMLFDNATNGDDFYFATNVTYCNPPTQCSPTWNSIHDIFIQKPYDNIFMAGQDGTIVNYESNGPWGPGDTLQYQDGYDLNALWGPAYDNSSSVPNLHVVGNEGVIRYFDGTNWSLPITIPTSENLYSIWGTEKTNIYAAGDNGTILHFDGNVWEIVSTPTTRSLYSIHGTGPDNIFAVGSKVILRFDGTEWKHFAMPLTQITSITALSNGTVIATGDNGGLLVKEENEWVPVETPVSDVTLNDVDESSSGEIFAVGTSGTIIKKSSGTWEAIATGTTHELKSVAALSPTDVVAVGEAGTILEINGDNVASISAAVTTTSINSVVGTVDDNVYAVGSGGSILRRSAGQWGTVPSGTFVNLNDVVALPSSGAVVIGDKGTISKVDGSNITKLTTHTTNNKTVGVFASNILGKTNAIATGDDAGNISITQGSQNIVIDTGVMEPILGIVSNNDGSVAGSLGMGSRLTTYSDNGSLGADVWGYITDEEDIGISEVCMTAEWGFYDSSVTSSTSGGRIDFKAPIDDGYTFTFREPGYETITSDLIPINPYISEIGTTYLAPCSAEHEISGEIIGQVPSGCQLYVGLYLNGSLFEKQELCPDKEYTFNTLPNGGPFSILPEFGGEDCIPSCFDPLFPETEFTIPLDADDMNRSFDYDIVECTVDNDMDDDGILDDDDNCPNMCNTDQFNADGDSQGDVCDETPGCGGCSGVPCEIEC